uniref:ATP synthase complex subunit 8 n=1 Tax=Mansonia uniformis TaxID=308735 RepID=A0A6H1YH39_9DIPT|nr:ATP synthase F0 subunit 8 [Mansonia uniformis]QJA27628.1 ATP synthase F0 subunit 8 [Mansonia uniformis]
MPQMAPISWLTLFFIFSLTMVIFNIKNYYCFFYKMNETSHSLKKNIKSMNWKW